MAVLRKMVLFTLGGLGYMGLELLWRGWSHSSMFLAGGTCFMLLGQLERVRPRLFWPLRAVLGSIVITSVELLTGLLVNRSYAVWDYRHLPWNFYGQICLPFSALWLPVSLGAMALHLHLDRLLKRHFHKNSSVEK